MIRKTPTWSRHTEGGTDCCSKCGGKLEPGQKFCPECGTPTGGKKAVSAPKRTVPDTVSGRKYDEAVRMGQEVEEWSRLNDMGPGCLDPIAFAGGPPIAGMVFFAAAAKWHDLRYFFGAIAALWLVAAFFRMKTRALLGVREIEGAKQALHSARVFSAATLLAIVVALLAFWLHVSSCAKQTDKQFHDAANEILGDLDEAMRRLQR